MAGSPLAVSEVVATVGGVLLTGTIRKGDEVDHVAAAGPDYELARLGLIWRVPEGYQIIAIRTDRDG